MKRLLLALLAAYLALVVFFWVFQRSFMYFPDQTLNAPATYGAARYGEVMIDTTDGLRLKSWYAPARKGLPTFVYYHGNGGNIAYRIGKTGQLVKAGYGVLLLEYRGFGGNPGQPSETGLTHDATAALDFLKTQGLATQDIIIYGESLGTALALKMAASHPPRAVILESPFPSIQAVAAHHYWFLPVGLLLKDTYDVKQAAATIKTPTLILIATKDKIVPPKFSHQILKSLPGPKQEVTFPEANHLNMAEYGAEARVLEFVRGKL